MIIPGFGNIPNSDLLCYDLQGRQINCDDLDDNLVAAGVYPITDKDGNTLNQAVVAERNSGPGTGKKIWGFPGEVVHADIEDNPYLKYIKIAEYITITVLVFLIFREVIK